MIYEVKIKRDNVLWKSGTFDDILVASNFMFEIWLDNIWINLQEPFHVYNTFLDMEAKLNINGFCHMWDCVLKDNIKVVCEIYKRNDNE